MCVYPIKGHVSLRREQGAHPKALIGSEAVRPVHQRVIVLRLNTIY